MADIGTAYVLIEPSAKGLGGKIENEMNGIGEKSGSAFSSGFGKVIGGVSKVALGAVTAGAGAMTAVTKQAVSAFGEYEQLVGGAELMFGDAYDVVAKNAETAFSRVQMSQNDYLRQANSFATGLSEALGGDKNAAANLADRIITAEADIVAATGNTAENVEHAFAGIMKNNFTMLDNLQIGITPTKEGFQEVIDKMNELNGTEYEMGNLADMQSALVDYIDYVGMAGYAEEEAAGTFQGSLAMLKASWQDTLTALGSGEGVDEAVQKVVSSASVFAKNLLPIVSNAVSGISTLIAELAPVIAAELPNLLTESLPGILEAGISVAQSLVEGILTALPSLLPSIVNFVIGLGNMIISNLPLLLKTGLMIIIELAKGIAAAIPELIPTITEVIVELAMMLTDPEMLVSLIDAALQIMIALAEGLIVAIPQLIERLPEIIERLVSALIDLAPLLLVAAGKLVLTLAEGLLKAVGSLVNAVVELWNRLKETWTSKIGDVKKWGKDLIDNFINGIKEKWESFKQTLSDLANTVKEFLGFSVPEKGPLHEWAYKNPGYDMVALFTEGMEEATPNLEAALSQNIALPMYDAMDFSATSNGGAGATNVTVKLEGDASKFFTYIQDQNRIYKKMNGESAFA